MPAAPKLDREVLTVSALTAQVRGLIEGKFPSVWVAGEVSNYTKAASGHMYLTLKDARAQLRAVIWRGVNLRLKFDPKDGLEVVARGRLSVYEPRGEYQFQIEELHPKGIGAAELALRQLKEKLLAKGYFDPRRKKPLPKFPARVALIASATGAAVRDMIELFAQRWPAAEVVVRPSRVQGDGAAEDVAVAVRMLNRLHTTNKLRLDAIIIGRGGGSAEDLWAFNEEAVADAIFQSAVPVVSAVGHEIDVTIADLVADHRAETPSAAVVALTPHRQELMAGLLDTHARLGEAVGNRLRFARQKLDQLAARPALRRPLQRVHDLEQKLDDTAGRLHRAAKMRLALATERLAAVAGQLDTLSPLNVLRRGYSLTRTADGRLVRTPADVQPGDRLITRVAEGEIISRVEETPGELMPDSPPTRFEDALRELEGILRDLEDGTTSLEDALARYERGVGLLRHCYGQLKDAEQRVRLLAGLTEDGRPDLQPFEHTSSIETAKVSVRRPAKNGQLPGITD